MIEGLNHATITWTFASRLDISTLVSYKDGMLLDVPQGLIWPIYMNIGHEHILPFYDSLD